MNTKAKQTCFMSESSEKSSGNEVKLLFEQWNTFKLLKFNITFGTNLNLLLLTYSSSRVSIKPAKAINFRCLKNNLSDVHLFTLTIKINYIHIFLKFYYFNKSIKLSFSLFAFCLI